MNVASILRAARPAVRSGVGVAVLGLATIGAADRLDRLFVYAPDLGRVTITALAMMLVVIGAPLAALDAIRAEEDTRRVTADDVSLTRVLTSALWCSLDRLVPAAPLALLGFAFGSVEPIELGRIALVSTTYLGFALAAGVVTGGRTARVAPFVGGALALVPFVGWLLVHHAWFLNPHPWTAQIVSSIVLTDDVLQRSALGLASVLTLVGLVFVGFAARRFDRARIPGAAPSRLVSLAALSCLLGVFLTSEHRRWSLGASASVFVAWLALLWPHLVASIRGRPDATDLEEQVVVVREMRVVLGLIALVTIAACVGHLSARHVAPGVYIALLGTAAATLLAAALRMRWSVGPRPALALASGIVFAVFSLVGLAAAANGWF